MTRKRNGVENSGGLTLVELLVVMAITGTLAGVLVPVVYSARTRAREVVCTNNLHQIFVAMHTYNVIQLSLPIDSYEDGAGTHFGDYQTSHLWSGSLGVKRGLGLMVPNVLEESRIFFEPDSNWTQFQGPCGWKDPTGTANWEQPGRNVMSSYVYRQNFGRRVARDRAGIRSAIVTEYTDLNNNRYNHGGKGAHILFDDGRVGWYSIDTPETLLNYDWFTLSAIDAGTGNTGWESLMDPMAGQ